MTIAIPGTRNDGLLYFFFIIYHLFVYMGSICYVPLPVEACNKDTIITTIVSKNTFDDGYNKETGW